MDEYSWPDWSPYRDREHLAQQGWLETVQALPVGARITAEVIGRQPFGVFLRIGDCVEGFISRADLPLEHETDLASGFQEGQAVQVRVVEVDRRTPHPADPRPS